METATGNSRQTTTTSGKPTKATTAKATKPTTRAKPAGRAKPATGSKPATKAAKPATRAGRAKPAKAATKPATTARTRTRTKPTAKPTTKPAAPPAEPTSGTDLAAGDPVRSTDPVVDPAGSSSPAESAAAGPVRMPDPGGPPQPADLATAGSIGRVEAGPGVVEPAGTPPPTDVTVAGPGRAAAAEVVDGGASRAPAPGGGAEGGRVSWGLGKAAEAAGVATDHDERSVRPTNGPVSRRARGPSEAGSLRFVAVARALSAVARREGWTSPAFRSPPGLVGVSRTIRRQRDGTATISVVLRGRPWAAVLADMVEGVVAANRLQGTAADRCRTALWRELREVGEEAA